MNGYFTRLDWSSGLTQIVCKECKHAYIAGAKPTHSTACSQFTVQRPKRREVSIRRILSYQVYAQLDENGNIIIP